MFTRDGVTLRALDVSDIDTMYPWFIDIDIDTYASWGPRRSPSQFQKVMEERILEPNDNLIHFGIEFEGRLVGRISLQQIDREHRIASAGFFIGEKSVWGRGIGTRAMRILLDYAFTIENLDKVYAETYEFNTRSMRMLERCGFQKEGILRRHEVHHGARRDMHFYGILKEEFYAANATMFPIPTE